jgi:hypothetical protein
MAVMSFKDESGKLSDVEINDLIAQWIKQTRGTMDRDTLDQFIIEKARAHGLTVIRSGPPSSIFRKKLRVDRT